MNSLTEKKENEHLIEKAHEFVAVGNQAFNGLAIAVYEIERRELWREKGYESFVEFYQEELGRKKDSVSRLKNAGSVLVAAGYTVDKLPETNIPYKAIADAKSHFPDMEPKLLLATAQTWNPDDYKQDRKDNCPGPDLDMTTVSAKCKACKGWHKLPDAPQSPKIGS